MRMSEGGRRAGKWVGVTWFLIDCHYNCDATKLQLSVVCLNGKKWQKNGKYFRKYEWIWYEWDQSEKHARSIPCWDEYFGVWMEWIRLKMWTSSGPKYQTGRHNTNKRRDVEMKPVTSRCVLLQVRRGRSEPSGTGWTLWEWILEWTTSTRKNWTLTLTQQHPQGLTVAQTNRLHNKVTSCLCHCVTETSMTLWWSSSCTRR